jgi:long-chain acyl-CoA synthetase
VLGEDVLAVVRPRSDASVTLDELQTFLRERLADYKYPRILEVVHDPLPRTSLDKIDRRALRSELGLN